MCNEWHNSNQWMFHVANIFFIVSYSFPLLHYYMIPMNILLISGFLLQATWAWHIACALDIFIWNVCFACINLCHLIYTLYLLRPVKFRNELEEAYHKLFEPFEVSRLQFKKLANPLSGTIHTLHIGETYAVQNLTRTDRLSLLLCGKASVSKDRDILHTIGPCEFLDSPEFESHVSEDDKFKVTITATTPCTYMCWQRTSLEYLFIKETYLSTVVSTLVAADVSRKLNAMNKKVFTEDGAHMDIRLVSISPAIAATSSFDQGETDIPINSTVLTPTSNEKSSLERKQATALNMEDRCLRYHKQFSLPNITESTELVPLMSTHSSDQFESCSDSLADGFYSTYQSCEFVDATQTQVVDMKAWNVS